MSSLKSSEAYLQQSTEHFLVLKNLSNDSNIGSAKVYLSSLAGGSLAEFIKANLGATTEKTEVWIEHRKDIGTTHRKHPGFPSWKLEVHPTSAPSPAPAPAPEQAVAPVQSVAAPVPHHAYPIHTHHPAGYPGMGFPGMGFGEAVQMAKDQERLADAKEQIRDLKEEVSDLKAEVRTLTIEKRELETKVSIAESKEQMAVMLAKAENRSFFDSPAFESLMQNAPQLLATMAAKSGAPPAALPTGLAGADTLPPQIREVAEYIAEECTVEQAQYIGGVLHFIDTPDFLAELKQLMEKYSTHGSGNHTN